jgi:hypothetical protein
LKLALSLLSPAAVLAAAKLFRHLRLRGKPVTVLRHVADQGDRRLRDGFPVGGPHLHGPAVNRVQRDLFPVGGVGNPERAAVGKDARRDVEFLRLRSFHLRVVSHGGYLGKVEGHRVGQVAFLRLHRQFPEAGHAEGDVLHRIDPASPLRHFRHLRDAVSHVRHPGGDGDVRSRHIGTAGVVKDQLHCIHPHVEAHLRRHQLHREDSILPLLKQAFVVVLLHARFLGGNRQDRSKEERDEDQAR